MGERRVATDQHSMKFDEKELKVIMGVIKTLERPLEVIYHLMNYNNNSNVTIILISAKEADLGMILDREKRDSDLLYKIEGVSNLFAIMCQETQVDQGYWFSERLLKRIKEVGGRSIYVNELEIGTNHTVQSMLMRLSQNFIATIQEEREGEITFQSAG